MNGKVIACFVGVLFVLSGVVVHSVWAAPHADVGFELYHYEGGTWVRYYEGDSMPPGGDVWPTNLWKCDYLVINHGLDDGIYQLMVFFNSDNVRRAEYADSLETPPGWETTYFPPVGGDNNWKMRFRAVSSEYWIAAGDSLAGFSIQFRWVCCGQIPEPQYYDVVSTSGSEPGVTYWLPAPISGVSSGGTDLSSRGLDLSQNYPNPFRPGTDIRYVIPADVQKVTLSVYDVRGRLVRTLVNETKPAGEHRVRWDGRDNSRGEVPSGVYFYHLTVDGRSLTKRMVLMK